MADEQREHGHEASTNLDDSIPRPARSRTVNFLVNVSKKLSSPLSSSSNVVNEKAIAPRPKSTFGILADKKTDEVPGSVLLLSPTRNEPLGYDQMESHREDLDARFNSSQKKTPDGRFVLDPQPEESPNDPLNWPAWRRDLSLLSLGYYCMVGGGMTPILAAGFNRVAQTYSVDFSKVALTTGLYMMGLGVGSVIFSPTAILWGKRPVYLVSVLLFVLTSVWCALAPSYAQLVVARVFQGVAVSPVECLPSSSIAEIFFLHERAFRIGIYTLLLLGGKNLIPLVSAAVIESLGWRWVFWIVAICVGFGGILLFFFVPETFWDRTPRPRKRRRTLSRSRSRSRRRLSSNVSDSHRPVFSRKSTERLQPRSRRTSRLARLEGPIQMDGTSASPPLIVEPQSPQLSNGKRPFKLSMPLSSPPLITEPPSAHIFDGSRPFKLSLPMGPPLEHDLTVPHLHNLNSPYYSELEKGDDYFAQPTNPMEQGKPSKEERADRLTANAIDDSQNLASPDAERGRVPHPDAVSDVQVVRYTTGLRNAPPIPWIQTLKPFNGRISHAKWWRVACRPFVLFAYPHVLWSAMVYSLSVGWLIVLSESVAHVYENRASYNFDPIQVGLVYISPFVGGVLGTAVAGRLSDVVVRFMARRNGGIYEPEFRLVMAIPVAITTAIGLMGFGWSAQEKDNFMVPTIFFGIISFGCCVGSTTSITFCLDSYRQFSGEALVTLNFSKNILHGLIWSLFFPSWLQSDGSKTVFLAIGGIQIACLLTTIPMYIYGKRARMWTVRKRMMERL